MRNIQINRDDFYLFNPFHKKDDFRRRIFTFYKKYKLEDYFYEQVYKGLIHINDIDDASWYLYRERWLDDTWMLIDKISSYQEFPEFKDRLLKIISGSKKLKKVHDDLIQLNLEIRKKYPHNNIELINYTDETINDFECEIENIKFKLPRSDIELFMVSDRLENCVDGYYSRIKSKNCVIVYCTDHTGDIIACLEFRNYYGGPTRLVQALGYDNELLDKKVQAIVRKYCKERDIDIDCKYHIPDVEIEKDGYVLNTDTKLNTTDGELHLYEVG
ncbi:hypothetical protein COO16_04225 [Bacillus pseudomycoides]|uniref:PcfJ domain-containing protein n=1 Tax=Bacillus pseudomycoides TaxID=64104 RepID=UPI000BEE531B|nr:PcfJ domain-containing protein [Bacillus pseudomycoides]PDY14175.1 hypothetical protein COO16_04225 [Bacillus pseudomycoides]